MTARLQSARRMVKSRVAAALAVCALFAALPGCASILDGDTMSVTTHTGAAPTVQPEGAPEASNYIELKAALLELVTQRAESGQIRINSYEGDIHADVDRACFEIKNNDPLGAYALSDITASATQYVTYFEVDAELSYKRTREQLDSRINVSTIRYFRSELLRFMSDYLGEAVVWTDVRDITAEDISEYVRELYYENPLLIVMLPSLGIEMFPSEPGDGPRLFELTFNYRYSASMLASYNRQLRDTVSTIAGTVSGGDNDGMILLELARKLADSCVYNEGRAAIITEYGVQSFEATAYGALMDGNAVGEGYAMAYKALCGELGIECNIVLGTLGGAAHAWNIVALEGDYYHVDVSMCSKNGIETAFLLRDDDMPEDYQWDRELARACNGKLTYSDFADIATDET